MNTNLSTREKVFICIVVIAVLCTVFYMFLLRPQLESIASLELSLTDKQKEVSQYKNFDQTIENTSNEVNTAKETVKKSINDWHDTLIQPEIINDLQSKIYDSKLYDTNITFTNVQQMNIVSAGDMQSEEEIPTIAESLAMAYLCLTQENTESSVQTGSTAPSPAPAASSSPSASAAPNSGDMVLNPQPPSAAEMPDVPPELTSSFEAFKNSLNNLSDEERRNEVKKIMARSNTNIEKLDISIAFQDSTYQSILSFINSINNDNPKIYITSISYSDSTDSYISKLNAIVQKEQQEEAERQAEEIARLEEQIRQDFFNNVYPSAETTRAQINPKAAVKNIKITKDDQRFYTGSITISYFSLVKMKLDNIDNMINDLNPVSEQNQDAESAKL